MFEKRQSSWQLLKEAYERAQKDPFFLAHDLEKYRREKNIKLECLAEHLECPDVLSLMKLGFCRSISPDETGFEEKLRSCARYAKVCPERLYQVLKAKEDQVGNSGL